MKHQERDSLYSTFSVATNHAALWPLPLTAGAPLAQMFPGVARVADARFSPDGHWIAYGSAQSGGAQVYLQAFPGPGERVQVSKQGLRGSTVSEIKHRTVETNGIHMHIAESGAGPLVVLCHGFPESWYSWRHQLRALAEAGFHAIAPDMRGYGQTDRPEQLERYTLLHSVGDVVGLLDALGTETAVIVGHDWGAPVAWYAALLRPDRFRGVIGLSVPFIPRQPVRPTSIMPQTKDAQFFQLYFQSPGIAEAEFERDVRLSIRSFLYSASGDGRDDGARDGREVDMVPRRDGFLSRLTNPASLPHWLTEADVDFYASEFARTGFRGG
jgi:pimeloyl-ACP methyl ester carboxylesterase